MYRKKTDNNIVREIRKNIAFNQSIRLYGLKIGKTTLPFHMLFCNITLTFSNQVIVKISFPLNLDNLMTILTSRVWQK